MKIKLKICRMNQNLLKKKLSSMKKNSKSSNKLTPIRNFRYNKMNMPFKCKLKITKSKFKILI